MYIPIEKKYYLSNKEIAESLIGAVIGSINPKQELGNSQNGKPNEISLSKDNSISSTWNIKFIEKMYEELPMPITKEKKIYLRNKTLVFYIHICYTYLKAE